MTRMGDGRAGGPRLPLRHDAIPLSDGCCSVSGFASDGRGAGSLLFAGFAFGPDSGLVAGPGCFDFAGCRDVFVIIISFFFVVGVVFEYVRRRCGGAAGWCESAAEWNGVPAEV